MRGNAACSVRRARWVQTTRLGQIGIGSFVKNGPRNSGATEEAFEYARSGNLGKMLCVYGINFPFALDTSGTEHRGKSFAIVIDEAHSSQGSKTSAAMSAALSEAGAEEEDETTEDKIEPRPGMQRTHLHALIRKYGLD